MKIGSREKVYIIAVILLLGVLSVKSVYFDEIKNLNDGEKVVVQNMYQTLDEKYDNFLYKSGFLTFRVVKLKEASENDVDFYRAKARKYLLQILPIQEVTIDMLK
ncbi:MAG: hypothetical protein WBA54_01965 [Acidaminobacteraceae bacterium]